jgi:hypothetical protein
MPQFPAHGAMVATEDTIDRGSKVDFDRARIKTFVSRKDVIAQLQSYGISSEEALARVDSLTDQEIAQIADKLDQLPAGALHPYDMFYLALLAAALIIAIIIAIIAYALDEGPNKPTYREF